MALEAAGVPTVAVHTHVFARLVQSVAQANGIGLMFCGHVHGGGIRVPLFGSLFVPSIYGRRFDYGVFEQNATVMAVNRGVSGKEPLRIRCNPQVLRVTLKTAPRG